MPQKVDNLVAVRYGFEMNTDYLAFDPSCPGDIAVDEFSRMVDRHCAANFGPTIKLIGPDIPLGRRTVIFNFDCLDDYIDELQLTPKLKWQGSGFHKAARAYKTEAGWDHAPGDSGIWITECMIVRARGGGENMAYDAHLLAFAIIRDRDEDGAYESLAHLWTCRLARGRGIMSSLLIVFAQQYPISVIEGPVTLSGERLLKKAWPKLWNSYENPPK